MFGPFTLILAVLIALVVGYVARLYVAKRWPNEQKLVDTIATKYGEAAATKVAIAIGEAKSKLR